MSNSAEATSSISRHMREQLLDIKSKPVYDRWWSLYEDFCNNGNLQSTVYSTFFDFVGYLAEYYKVSTIWQACSCVNKYLMIRHETGNFLREETFKTYMKQLGKNYVPKQSSVFTLDDVSTLLDVDEASVEMKVSIILGVYGGLRISELVGLNFEDVIYDSGHFKVVIKQSKTDPAGNGHTFFVSPCGLSKRCPVNLLMSYIELFPVDQQNGRFLRMIKNGRGELFVNTFFSSLSFYWLI